MVVSNHHYAFLFIRVLFSTFSLNETLSGPKQAGTGAGFWRCFYPQTPDILLEGSFSDVLRAGARWGFIDRFFDVSLWIWGFGRFWKIRIYQDSKRSHGFTPHGHNWQRCLGKSKFSRERTSDILMMGQTWACALTLLLGYALFK